jgi:hypothetical protein
MSKYTRIDYMYRDASNYKFRGYFSVEGTLKQSDLEDFLYDGEFFVPREVGLNHLLDVPMNQDDHHLHTIEAFSLSDDGEALCDSRALVNRFKMANERTWLSSFFETYGTQERTRLDGV